MKISLVGMSGSGKSYWSKKFQAEGGFKRFCCDEMIKRKLGGNVDVAAWMGQPFSPGYKARSREYLRLEKKVMEEIFKAISSPAWRNKNIVIDTTGSVIYMSAPILRKLSRLTTVICLDTPMARQREMYRIYLNHPKPVIWGKLFKKNKGESDQHALGRCYRRLLAWRSKKYNQIAAVILGYTRRQKFNLSINKFLEAISYDSL